MDLEEASKLPVSDIMNGWVIAVAPYHTNYNGKQLCAIFVMQSDLEKPKQDGMGVHAEIFELSQLSSNERNAGETVDIATKNRGKELLNERLQYLANEAV